MENNLHMDRMSWDEYYLSIAQVVAKRATCPRLHAGTVLVKNQMIISTGYNGSGSGQDHCIDKGCIMDNGHCIRTIHSELNAILQAAKNGVSIIDSTAYVTHSPCLGCFKHLYQVGVNRIVYSQVYRPVNYAQILSISPGDMPFLSLVPLLHD